MALHVERGEVNVADNLIYVSKGYISNAQKESGNETAFTPASFDYYVRNALNGRRDRLETLLECQRVEYIFEPGPDKFFKLFFDFDSKESLELTREDIVECFAFVVVQLLERFDQVRGNVEPFDAGLREWVREGLTVTRSTNPERSSFHVFCTNVFVNQDAFIRCKAYLREILAKHAYKANIDLNLYKKNPSLRSIYSYKVNDESKAYHVPFLEDEDEPVRDFSDYTFSAVAVSRQYVFLESSPLNPTKYNMLPFSMTGPLLEECVSKALQKKFKQRLASNEMFREPRLADVDKVRTAGGRGTFSVGSVLQIDLTACFCKDQEEHKEGHEMCVFFEDRFMVLRKRNGNICDQISIAYPRLSIETICQFLGGVIDLYGVEDDDSVMFVRTEGGNVCVQISDSDLLRMTIRNCAEKHILRQAESLCLDSKMRDVPALIRKYIERKVTVHENPYALQFRNGVLFLYRERRFVTPPASYEVFNYVRIDRDYVDLDRTLRVYQERRAIIESYLNKIISFDSFDGRIAWRNLAQILLHKPNIIITFMVGGGSSGKTTLMQWCQKLLGSQLYHLISVEAYIEKNKKSSEANSQLAQMNHKQLVQSVEPHEKVTFNSSAIRVLTETKFPGRSLFKDNTKIHNVSTQIILTNSLPKFEKYNDVAIARRVAIVFVDQTYFIPPEASRGSLVIDTGDFREVLPADPAMEKLVEHEMSMRIFLDILHTKLYDCIGEDEVPGPCSTGTARYNPEELLMSMIKEHVQVNCKSLELVMPQVAKDNYSIVGGTVCISKEWLKKKLLDNRIPHSMFLIDILENEHYTANKKKVNTAFPVVWKDDLI